MIILVDYDNIDKAILRHGIVYVINKIVSKVDTNEITSSRHITVRLYGGWYEQTHFTRRAQNLSADILASFPSTATLSDNQTSVFINCEMAYSLLADPTNHLFHTYRPRGIPQGLKAKNPSTCGCSATNCSALATYQFIINDICTSCNTIKPKDILYRSEQKLIDTMLTSDLIFSSNQSFNLCIVSSDDDFWPGIMTTLTYGKKVIHIHTRNRNTPSFYTRNTGNNYIQKYL